MISRTKLTIAFAGTVFFASLAYAGYASELLKGAVSESHRAILIIGFILGAGAVSRWIMEQDYKRSIRRIKQARANRKGGR
jgi:4-hydroxybenzoate polyprenyltransferase